MAGTAISPALMVRVLDGFGNLANSNVAVTLALGANPGGATLGGTATVKAVSGVASFANLSLNRNGNGYTLAASSGGLTGAISGESCARQER